MHDIPITRIKDEQTIHDDDKTPLKSIGAVDNSKEEKEEEEE